MHRRSVSRGTEDREYAVLSGLCQVLRKNGSRILSGESKLALTTQSLGLLDVAFRRLSDTESTGLAPPASTSFSRISNHANSWKKDVEFLRDFISKTVAIKVMHGTNTMQGPIHIQRFRSLRVIEVKKVPIHMIEGLQVLRGQLTSVIVARSVEHIQDLFETCGGDMSAPMSWPQLRSACLSFNGIHTLDGSLRLLPSLEILDASHNQLERSDNNLEYLTELQRLHLGYNCLDALPTFSLSCKSKLKTLVMKNNYLDNIEGVEDLTILEELDVSGNLIADHACLQPLTGLLLLKRLNTQENPLSYHNNHRKLTVARLAVQAVTTQFELDGKLLSVSEATAARPHHMLVNDSRRPSSIAHKVITGTQRVHDRANSSGNLSEEYSFNESDSIATSLPVGTTKRRGRRRNKRTQEIADLDSSATEVSSRESSRASSPVRDSQIEDHVNTRQKVELLREHYGPNWLQAMDDHFKGNNKGVSDVSNSAASDSDTAEGVRKDVVINGHEMSIPTEDDLYLNEATSPPLVSMMASIGQDQEKQLNGVNEDKSVEKSQDVINAAKALLEPQSAGLEWTRSEDEEIESYGEESEPFIVFLKHRNCEQMFLTFNQRYILEKNINGRVVERLDMRSVISLEQSNDKVIHEDMEELPLPHIKLTFDYVRRDRRERVYVMESDECARRVCEFLEPFLKERDLKSQPKFINQCLKCSHMFSKTQARRKSTQLPLPTIGKRKDIPNFLSQESIMVECPKCGSDKVIQVEKTTASQPSSNVSTPFGSFTASGTYLSPTKGQKQASEPLSLSPSPLAKSTPQKQGTIVSDVEKSHVRRNLYSSSAEEAVRQRSNAFSEISTRPKSDSIESQPVSVTTPTENKAFRRASWSDIEQGLPTRTSYMRIASQESDITILTNPSEGSIAVISESSSETLSALTPVEERKSLLDEVLRSAGDKVSENGWLGSDGSRKLLVDDSKQSTGDVIDGTLTAHGEECDIIVRSASEPKQLNLKDSNFESGIDKEEITPMGSPLTNSVCSSMVSSVYQNSGCETGKIDGKINTSEMHCHSIPEDSPSIYDSGIANSLSGDRRTSCSESTDTDIAVCVAEGGSVELVLTDDALPDDEEIMTRDRSAAMYEHPFTHVDHWLKLHLMMTYFDDNEEFECILKCDVCQYLSEEDYKAILVMTAAKFYIFKVAPDDKSENVADWLTTVDIQPITELCHVDVGLGLQTFRLEFDTECSCYTFIVRDKERCRSFVEFMAELLEKNVLNLHHKVKAKFDWITRETTVTDLQKEVLTKRSDEEQQLILYLMGYVVRGHNKRYPISFVLGSDDICLVRENLQWPQPRMQAPLSVDSAGKHFTVLERQPINNIATVEVCEADKTRMRLAFFSEQTGLETDWLITMETTNGVQSLVDGLRAPWEEEFGVELDVTLTTFSESDSEDL